MSETALITGASKGIGREFAVLFAERKCDLVLVARSADQLEELKEALSEKHGVHVHTIVKDLAAPNAVNELFREVKALGVDVDYVVNNAGFGDHGAFVDTQWERYEEMIALNVKDLLSAAMIFAIYGFLICLLWAEMGAVDVAFTEATVGAGISTVLFIATILNTRRRSSD